MKRISKFACALFFISTSPVLADQTPIYGRSSEPVSTLRMAQHADWDSLGCVHSDHECYHRARNGGFPHYRLVHSNQCHTHMLCLGGHH
ncbi:hypothetical protein F1D61_32545 (plasmid) [Methylobacterium aquaticum]|nr:hypothetical protein F1D61_32545 [Methylobacterium aquaticum]